MSENVFAKGDHSIWLVLLEMAEWHNLLILFLFRGKYFKLLFDKQVFCPH
jgi:hypothetical protein